MSALKFRGLGRRDPHGLHSTAGFRKLTTVIPLEDCQIRRARTSNLLHFGSPCRSGCIPFSGHGRRCRHATVASGLTPIPEASEKVSALRLRVIFNRRSRSQLTSAYPQIAADLLQRASRPLRAKSRHNAAMPGPGAQRARSIGSRIPLVPHRQVMLGAGRDVRG
jgi:hypothetical protein